MARKTTDTTTRNRKKAAVVPISEAAETRPQTTGGDVTDVTAGPADLEDQIRIRAYELYLQRHQATGNDAGDQNQDWLLAEREVLSRLESGEHRSA